MTLQFVYPRLPRSVARLLLEELSGKDSVRARAMAAMDHPAAAPIATGGPHVPRDVIERTAQEVRLLADALGYPAPLPRTGVARFDQPCGEVLVDEMRILPADAASEDVWSFMTLVVMPDIAIWRFPELLPERFLGLPRNTFRRLWWRSFTLEGQNRFMPNGPDPLGEDALVAIFERPTLSRTAVVAQAMTVAVRAVECAGVSPTDAMRELAKRMRRFVAFMALDLMGRGQLERLVSEQLVEAIQALGGDMPQLRDTAAAGTPAQPDESSTSMSHQARPTEWHPIEGEPPSGSPPVAAATSRQVVRSVTDEDRIKSLMAGGMVRLIQHSPSGGETISATLEMSRGVVEIQYSLRGHRTVSGQQREYHHMVREGPAAALAWLRSEHDEVLAGNRAPPARDLRQELD